MTDNYEQENTVRRKTHTMSGMKKTKESEGEGGRGRGRVEGKVLGDSKRKRKENKNYIQRREPSSKENKRWNV